MKVRHLKHRPRKRTVWLDGGTFVVPKDTVDAISAWLRSFVK